MLVIAVPTGVRLHLRATKQQMVWGSDDWAILVAAVSEPVRAQFEISSCNVVWCFTIEL